MEIIFAALLYAAVIIFNFKPILKNNLKKEIWVYLIFIIISFGITILRIMKPDMNSIAHLITGIISNFADVK